MGDDLGKLILRLALGILVLLHGVAKLHGGIGFLHPMLGALGLPTWVAYGVYVGEIVGPIMVILGLLTRVGAFIIFVNMIFAIVLVHRPELLSQGGWALELQGMFLFTAVALALIGPGRFSINRR